MRMRWPAVALALALPAGATATAADPAAWLLRVSEAARQASYQGVVVYRHANSMEVLRVVHRQHRGATQERLTTLTGKPREILQDGDRLSCAGDSPPLQTGRAGGLFPVLTAAALTRAADHYRFRDLGEARVAGRACRGLALQPRDEYRYGYEICADRETAVPLRVALRDSAGRTIEQLIFTEVAFPSSIADTAFESPPGSLTQWQGTPRGSETASAHASWQLVQLPPGFHEVARTQRPAPGGIGIIEHALLSDGLSAVSVFSAPREAGQQPDGSSSLGGLHAHARTAGARLVTVVGEVPASTVRLIAEGFRPIETTAR
ncbi:MAG TPA: MucB/RseB C-terminal domain-containing protein [Verrucomicrobiae bacterium]|nr:MucB/RseB C-terminal domain-containing protein [Verrucomicrobiae bacterium]